VASSETTTQVFSACDQMMRKMRFMVYPLVASLLRRKCAVASTIEVFYVTQQSCDDSLMSGIGIRESLAGEAPPLCDDMRCIAFCRLQAVHLYALRSRSVLQPRQSHCCITAERAHHQKPCPGRAPAIRQVQEPGWSWALPLDARLIALWIHNSAFGIGKTLSVKSPPEQSD
jgi:hypothetical protein